MNKVNAQYPSFVCIGAQKAGTTWLYDNLCHHPDVWMPPVKELHFFNSVCPHEQLLGVETYNPSVPSKIWRNFFKKPSLSNIRWLKKFYLEQKSSNWYRDLFADVPAGKCAGDITPGYSTLDERGVAYARQLLPENCKVFVILRNPIERLWSSIKMNYRWKGEDIRTEKFSSLKDEMRIPSNYLRTDYYRIITLWRKYFDKFEIFIFDDLVEDPLLFYSTVEDYLGIQRHAQPKVLGAKSNADGKQLAMPLEVQEFLFAEYEGAIDNLEELLPGIKARWFG